MSDDSISRRDFVTQSLTAGFALAAMPISAFAITTDTKGLVAGEISIPTLKGHIPAYRAKPVNAKNPSVVLVCHEIFGVHAHIQDLCRRLAKAGYLAIAPDLFHRQGDATKIASIDELIAKIVSKTPLETVMTDLDATLKHVSTTEKANPAQVGVTGFCWGGRTTWLYCAHNPSIKAGVAWYGPVTGNAPNKDPLDIAASLTVPVLGLYAGKDGHIKLDGVKQMEEKLKTGKSGSKIIVYPNADHGFNADYRPSYNREAAEDGWKQMLGWFSGHGVPV
jgi:carboxymethylenebutenolidase